jgi:hypothetical protein
MIQVSCAVRPLEVDGKTIDDEAVSPLRVVSDPNEPWAVYLYHPGLPKGFKVKGADLILAVQRATFSSKW